MATQFDLQNQTAVPLNYFTSKLASIPVNEPVTVIAPASLKTVKRALIFAGLSIKSSQTDENDVITYVVVRPEKAGAKPVAVQPAPVAPEPVAPAQDATFQAWGINPNVTSTVVDESALLQQDGQDDGAEAKQFDCGSGTGPRKACKNCTCGLAQQEVADKQAENAEGTGGCGNCSLGDAYRCASCPSLGKPAWKNVDGQPIRLNTEDPSV